MCSIGPGHNDILICMDVVTKRIGGILKYELRPRNCAGMEGQHTDGAMGL